MDKLKKLIKLEDAIKNIFKENNQEFFSYAWRENVENFLSAENRYTQLIDWINEQIEINLNVINVFNPADKDSAYSIGYLKNYLDSCQKIGVLINAKTIILDEKCTTKMRENWEYTLCKIFNLVYNKDIGFVVKDKRG